MTLLIRRGPLRAFTGKITGADPFKIEPDGAVVFDDDMVVDHGAAWRVMLDYPGAMVIEVDEVFNLGLSDAHTHFPQMRVMGTYGGALLQWLEHVVFPEEAKFSEPSYAAAVARAFLDTCEAVGTTDVTVFCTSHPESVDALFAEAENRDLTVTAGLVMMDRNAPTPLLTPAQDAYDQSKALIEKWHGAADGRLQYAISPRFAPTSTHALLEAAATLWEEHPTCAMQTHLSESVEEVAWVERLFPNAPDYLSVYESFGLLKPGALFAHGIHLTDREVAALAEHQGVVVHCPTANRFLRSGRCDVGRLLEAGVSIRLGSDVGAGTTFDLMEVAAESECRRVRPPQ